MYQFAAVQQAGAVKLAAIFQNFQKTLWALRVNETKITLKNAFIDNIFSLESEKEFKKYKRTLS